MKETGCLTKLKDKVHSGMQREMFIEVNLKTTWLMGMENILISTDLNIKESLETMCKKVMEKKNGLMVPNTSEAIKTE